jgi:hypothetical protein
MTEMLSGCFWSSWIAVRKHGSQAASPAPSVIRGIIRDLPGLHRIHARKQAFFVGLAWEIGLIKRDFSDPRGFTACLLERLMMIVERAGEEGDIGQGDRYGVLGMQALDLEMGDHAEYFLAEAADIAAEVLSQLRAPDVRSFLEQAMVLIKPVGGLPEAMERAA